MKVLLMAYECSPYRGSEWAVGWGRLLEGARAAELHVITSESNFAALQRADSEGLLPAGVRYYTPTPDAALRKMEQKPALFAYNYTAYHHWQKLAFELARSLHATEKFDLVHQVNVCTFREPGYTWQLDIPYLWGPVGGTQNFPFSFLSMLHPVEAIKEFMRAVSNECSLRFKGRVRAAARHAAMIIGANSTNQRDYERVFQRDVGLLLETGLRTVIEPDRSRFQSRVDDKRAGRSARPIKLLWSGEFQTRKALPILLRALARLEEEDVRWELDILGNGPMWTSWIAETGRLGLLSMVREPVALAPSAGPGTPPVLPEETLGRQARGQRQLEQARAAGRNIVHFLGRLPFQEAVAKMNEAEVFCFTSLRDTSGNVVLEALAAGVPVVCFDHQGAADMVSDDSGVLLPVVSPSAAVTDWAATLRELVDDPEYLLELSEGTTEQARKFLWSTNGDRINEIYRELASRHA
ncbi:glycosyltransferase family 4 protein [Bryocella elongata]|uniref:glycosyltransferase family 4 protein n=1 Tax=Bryocella elongata TaxID=863522 RepID=UPI00135AB25D|nr:glycosyltransferase family 4 protein [Bryocella elongata]